MLDAAAWRRFKSSHTAADMQRPDEVNHEDNDNAAPDAHAMFATFSPHPRAYAQVHAETGVADADPHRLVELLFDGALDAISAAFAAVERGDLDAKRRSITRAAGIVDEGLRGSLDLALGGSVAKTLHDLYSCVLIRLTDANRLNDSGLLRECRQLLAPVRDAWTAIRPSAGR